MYGLFEYSYDYYEWETLECISDDKNKLEVEQLRLVEGENYISKRAFDEHEHNELASVEAPHYYIKKVTVL